MQEVWLLQFPRGEDWETREVKFSESAMRNYIRNYGGRWGLFRIAPAVIDEKRAEILERDTELDREVSNAKAV